MLHRCTLGHLSNWLRLLSHSFRVKWDIPGPFWRVSAQIECATRSLAQRRHWQLTPGQAMQASARCVQLKAVHSTNCQVVTNTETSWQTQGPRHQRTLLKSTSDPVPSSRFFKTRGSRGCDRLAVINFGRHGCFPAFLHLWEASVHTVPSDDASKLGGDAPLVSIQAARLFLPILFN